MKLKRFTAPDIRQAMTKVREELGADAVILSNRKTDDGIEIIAATDYDDAVVESPAVEQASPSRQKNQKVIKARKPATAKSSTNSDPLSTENTRNLAHHLKNTLDIKSSTSASKWKDAMEDSYVDESDDELEDLLNMDAQSQTQQPRNSKSKRTSSANKTAAEQVSSTNQNQTQVSSEWINQFSSQHHTPDEAPAKTAKQDIPNTGEMASVWDELSNLRGLLETQLSSLAWSDASKRDPVKVKALKHLLELGLTPEMSYSLLGKTKKNENFESCWRKSLATFARGMPTIEDDMIKKGGIFALVGPTGVGKTTTIAKMAARYALTHGTGSVALVTTDNYRIGAQEQLRTYGRILGTPVKIANNSTELRQVLKSLYDKDLVLIDTAGTSQRDIRLTEQFSMLSEGSSLIKSYLVLSASSQQQVLSETVEAYKKVHLDGCILTKLDESITLGGALSTIVQNKLPLAYISDGQRVPEDLHLANAVELVKRAVSMMNNAQVKLDDNVLEMAFGGLAAHDLS